MQDYKSKYVDMLGNLEGESENHVTFNGEDTERESFMSLDSPWFVLY